MGTFGPSARLCEACEHPTEREPGPSDDAASDTRKLGGFGPAAPTSNSFRSTASPLDAAPARHTLASSSPPSEDARESPTGAVIAEKVPITDDEEELRTLPFASDDDEEERRGRRLLRPSAMSDTPNSSRSRTTSKRTSRRPPKRLLSPDGKGPPCVCEETLASSPATIASPGSPPRDVVTLPRHCSVLPQALSRTGSLSPHMQPRTQIDSPRSNAKYRRRQSIASEHLARFVESQTPSSGDPQQSPPSSPPRAVHSPRLYSVMMLSEDPVRGALATPLDQTPVVGEKNRPHSGSSSSIASSLLSRYFSQGSSPTGSTSSETDATSLPTTSYGDPDGDSSVFCSSPEELHPPPPSAFLTSAWSSLTSLSALSFASTSVVTSQQVPEIGEQNFAVDRNRRRSGHASWPPSPPSPPETNAGSSSGRTSARHSNWSAIRSIQVRFRPCALSFDDGEADAGESDDADATVNAFTLRIQDLALQQQQQQAAMKTSASSLMRHSPTGLSTMPSRWPRVETCVGSPPSIKVEYWSGRKREIVPEGKDLDQVRLGRGWISVQRKP